MEQNVQTRHKYNNLKPIDIFTNHKRGSQLNIQNEHSKFKAMDKLRNHKTPNYLRVKDDETLFSLLKLDSA